jgi:chromosome segregation ATPase
MAAAEKARRQPLLKLVTYQSRSLGAECQHRLETSIIELPNQAELMHAKLAEFERQVARQPTAAEIPNEHVESLTAQTAAADKLVVELGSEVDLAREELFSLENENYSLQTSLALIGNEKSRLSRRLTESDSAVDKARSQLAQKKTALTAAEAERNRLAALHIANERRPTKANPPSTRPEVMSSSALAEEELWLGLLARAETSGAAERKVVDAIIAGNTVDKKVVLLQNSLQAKECQVQELEQSRLVLIEVAGALLKTFKMRDTTLASAEERIKFLAQRVVQLEAEANLAESQETIEEINSQLPCDRQERTVTDGAHRKAHINWTELLQELDDYVGYKGKYSERNLVYGSEKLLADTIAL